MKIIIHLFIIIIFISFTWSCGNKKEETKSENIKNSGELKLFTLKQGTVSSTIQLPGVLQPFQEVQIYPKVSGFIKNIYVDRGSVVKKDQVLMTLDAPEIEENAAAARLKFIESVSILQNSKDKYRRLLETSRTPGTVSAYDMQAAKSKMMADSAVMQSELENYNARKTMFSYLTVKASFDGIITERNVHPGALVGPGSEGNAKPMLILQEQSMLRLVTNIPEQFSAQVKDGAQVHFKINAIPGKDFVGNVSRSAGSLSEHFRAETVEIDVKNPDLSIKGGMYAEVNIPVAGDMHAFSVPKSVVVTTDESKYVLVIRDNKTKKVNVTEGNRDGDEMEIFGDLIPGEKVVAEANNDIPEGKMVTQ